MSEWRPVVGSGGRYEVAEDGTVRSLWCPNGWRKQPRILRAYPGWSDYLCHKLALPTGPKYKRVHQLVIDAFGPPKPEGHECAHKDGNRLNNHISNLTWKTHAENMADIPLHRAARELQNA